MKILPVKQALQVRRLLRVNISLGLGLFALAFILMVSGHYENYVARQTADALYNKLALGGLLFAAINWMGCVMSKPFWFPGAKKRAE